MSAFAWSGVVVAAQHLGLVALICCTLAIAVALLYGVARVHDRKRPKVGYWRAVMEALPYVAAVTLIGGLCGQLGGGSRESVVGSLLPAVLGIFGGFTAYYLGAKRDRSGKVAVNTLAFLIGFFSLYTVSAVWRQDSEAFEFCRALYSNPEFKTVEERNDRHAQWGAYCDMLFK